MAGWGFGTCLFFHSVGNFIIPIEELRFFRGVGSTTNQMVVVQKLRNIPSKLKVGEEVSQYIIRM